VAVGVEIADGTRSQTLHRGLVLLELLAHGPLSLPELSRRAGLHRSIVYRLLRTLEDHRLLVRQAGERYALGPGLLDLARGLATDLRSAAAAELAALADELHMTAFVVVRDGDDALTLLTVEPSASAAHVSYRPGHRHPVTAGAPGLALLMPAAPAAGDRQALTDARARGWAGSTGEVLPGLSAVAAPIPGRAAAVAVVYASGPARAELGPRLVAAAGAIAARMG
jgi:DNA-binding IclR family transcriptional regulator